MDNQLFDMIKENDVRFNELKKNSRIEKGKVST